MTRLEKTHRKGKALTILAHTVARAISSMFTRQTACDLDTFLQGCGRGGGTLTASLDSQGMPLIRHARYGVTHCVWERS